MAGPKGGKAAKSVARESEAVDEPTNAELAAASAATDAELAAQVAPDDEVAGPDGLRTDEGADEVETADAGADEEEGDDK